MGMAEVKYALNSSVGESDFEALDVTLGKRADAAGTSATAGLFGWVKDIRGLVTTANGLLATVNGAVSAINTNTARGAVKSVQRGTFNYGGASSYSVSISAVTLGKSALIVDWSSRTIDAYAVLNASSITFYVTGSQIPMVTWQVVEFY